MGFEILFIFSRFKMLKKKYLKKIQDTILIYEVCSSNNQSFGITPLLLTYNVTDNILCTISLKIDLFTRNVSFIYFLPFSESLPEYFVLNLLYFNLKLVYWCQIQRRRLIEYKESILYTVSYYSQHLPSNTLQFPITNLYL